MDESYGTYVDDEYVDNHDYDDDTDDGKDHKNYSYTKNQWTKSRRLQLGLARQRSVCVPCVNAWARVRVTGTCSSLLAGGLRCRDILACSRDEKI